CRQPTPGSTSSMTASPGSGPQARSVQPQCSRRRKVAWSGRRPAMRSA
ncbi:MAG: hypothetical protein AVDCRST_MAG21-924, partial [uncultured Nocardioidaceae bacterium]